jgi:hypothetical protein
MLAANPFDCRFLVAWVSVGAALQQQLYDYGYYQIRQQLAPIPAITLLRHMAASTARSWPTSTRGLGVTPNDVGYPERPASPRTPDMGRFVPMGG